MKELRKFGLLVKKDITEHNLLFPSLYNGGHDAFAYLVEWDLNALIHSQFGNELLIRVFIHAQTFGQIDGTNLLKAGFKCHPHIGGLLFIEDDSGTTALDYFCRDKKKAESFMGMLHSILSPSKDYPILHHIFTKAPQHKERFAKKFPWAGSLKDQNG